MSWKPEDGTIRRPDIQGMFHDVRVQRDQHDRDRARVCPLLERCEAILLRIGGMGEGATGDPEDRTCPLCFESYDQHAPGCELAALLADLRKELGK